jgi:hypothetical protein
VSVSTVLFVESRSIVCGSKIAVDYLVLFTVDLER